MVSIPFFHKVYLDELALDAGKTIIMSGRRWQRVFVWPTEGLCLLGLATLSLAPAEAATIFIGDGAAFGAALPAGTGTRADTLSPLSYLLSPEVGVSFTAPAATQIMLSSVNLLVQNAGSLTPFVAEFNGGSPSNAGSYTLPALGDALAIPGGSASGALFNGLFTVGGVNPILNLQANDTIIAGSFQSSRTVVFSATSQSSTNDRIWQANIINGVSPGQTLTGGGDGFNLNATYHVGFQPSAPEPGTLALFLVGMAGLFGYGDQRRRIKTGAA
jgi:hypothetical protein